MMRNTAVVLLLVFSVLCVVAEKIQQDESNDLSTKTDLDTSATSARLFNLGNLFGQNPGYPGYGPNYRPYYTTGNGYYPNTGYYPSTGWTGGSYYPNYGSYPLSGGYYPSTNGYYPSGGTNILGGNGGYGGYGGNGGLRQYNGYWNPDYTGQRNRGYGYFADTDRYGFPQRRRGSSDYYDSYGRDRDRVPGGGYRGYNQV